VVKREKPVTTGFVAAQPRQPKMFRGRLRRASMPNQSAFRDEPLVSRHHVAALEPMP
jgi:hypothetical protein